MEQTSPVNGLTDLSNGLADVVERTAPSVVRIDDGSRLTATGLIWSADGVVVATSHGVDRDEELTVELHDGSRHIATLVGRDSDTDLAVLRIDADGLTAPTQAETPRVGQLALALGRPGRSELHATIGIIGSRIDTETNGRPSYILYTDATFYPGFSGGPLVDVNGNLLGLNNLMFGRGRGVAVGAPTVAEVVNSILAGGTSKRGYLGVRTQSAPLPESVRSAAGQDSGLLVVNVEEGSPAQRGGLWIGDTILKLNDAQTIQSDDLRAALRRAASGTSAAVTILRGGETHTLEVTLG